MLIVAFLPQDRISIPSYSDALTVYAHNTVPLTARCRVPGVRGRLRPWNAAYKNTRIIADFSSAAVQAFRDCTIKDFECEVDLLLGDRDGWGDAEDAEAAAHDAGHHPEIEARAGDTLG